MKRLKNALISNLFVRTFSYLDCRECVQKMRVMSLHRSEPSRFTILTINQKLYHPLPEDRETLIKPAPHPHEVSYLSISWSLSIRSIQATPQYMPFILRNSDMAYSKSSGSCPYLDGESRKDKNRGNFFSKIESYFAMNPACCSSKREVGAFWGMSASFTITAILASTLK